MEENNTTTPSYNDTIRAIMKLSDAEKTVLLSYVDLNKIASVIATEENYIKSLDECTEYANTWLTIRDALTNLHRFINDSDDETDSIVENYDRLNAPQKKETALRLLNNGIFQRDCCEILVEDMERIVNDNANIKALNDVFNITGWYKKLIKQGIGLNHHYKK